MISALKKAHGHTRTRKRAVVAVQVAVLAVVLMGFAALTIDVGMMYNARGDLQRAADAGALAGAYAYTTDEMMRVRMGSDGNITSVIGYAQGGSTQYSGVNPSIGLPSTYLDPSDIRTGWLNVTSGTQPIQTNSSPDVFNAVEVTVRRQGAASEGGNGAVPFSFATIFGLISGETTATATAVFDDRFAGFRVVEGDTGVLPFTIHEDAFASELANGGDSYGYDGSTESVTHASDDIREIRLYPYPLSGAGYTEGDGNFGVLNIGTGNQGVSAESEQILNGVPPSDFEAEIGTSDLTFLDETGSQVSYDITGSPGLEATLTTPIEAIVGQVVGFFLHDNVVLSGSNATYTITQLRFGRVMDIRLTGPPHQRGLFIQPTSYVGSSVIIDEDAPSSDGLVGRIVLAR